MINSLFQNPTLSNASFWHGKRVGIFGGSFHPPHQGHMLIAEEALKRFNLDCIWWMVSPKNPLKSTSGHNDFDSRLLKTKEFVQHPSMIVTDIERELGTPHSYKTVCALKKHFPKTDFLWIAGMDNAALFHKWNDWRRLTKLIPFVFYNRPPSTYKIRRSHLKLDNTLHHIYDPLNVSSSLAPQHIYWVYKGRSINISSTEIRAKNGR